MLPIPSTVALHPAYRGLLDLLEARYVTSEEIATRWRWSSQHLSNLRRAGKGPAYAKLGRSIRYPLSEVISWELHGQSAHLTRDRVTTAVAALQGFDAAQRASIIQQLDSLLAM